MERLEDGIEEVVNVLLHDTGLLHVNAGDVAFDDISVRSAEEVESAITHLSIRMSMSLD